MSVPVPLDELGDVVASAGQAFLVTVSHDGRAHVAGVGCEAHDGGLVVSCGRRSVANAATNASVTLLFPTPRADGLVLLVDGDATADTSDTADAARPALRIAPTWAVLHQPSA